MVFGSLVVSVGSHEDIAWLWNVERKQQAVGSWPPHIQRLLGPGALANLNGRRHRALRRIVDSAFAPVAVRTYVEILDSVVQEQLREWAATADDPYSTTTFHSSTVFKEFALRLFMYSAYGRVDQDVLQQLHHDFALWIKGFGFPLALRIPGTPFAKAIDARERILDAVGLLVEQFQSENGPDSERAKSSMMGRICYGKDESGNPMSMDDLKDNVLNLLFAGHDT